MENYYDILGVDKTAPEDDIKKAYRDLAKKYHPDINKESNASDKFKKIAEAYEILSDTNKRSHYDNKLNGNPFDGDFFNFDLSNIFGNMWHGQQNPGSKKSSIVHGKDIEGTVEISLEHLLFGTEQSITFNRLETCDLCAGLGAKNGELIECNHCNGKGIITMNMQSGFMVVSQTVLCSNCSGNGKKPKNICEECNGEGRIKVEKNLTIKIPPGMITGSKMQVQKMGDVGKNSGKTGNLYLRTVINDTGPFIVEGRDLIFNIKTSFPDAVLGGYTKIIAHDNKSIREEEFFVPPFSDNGTVWTLKGRGIPHPGGISSNNGDLRIVLKIKMPKQISEKAKELLENLRQEIKVS